MNKAELLVDLAARDSVLALIGDPVDVTPSGDVAIAKWYQQNIWQQNGDAAVKQSITFYVIDEGEPGEVAYYKDREPELDDVRTAALKAWMRGVIDANPNSYRAAQVHWLSERWEMIVYSILEDDGASGLKWQTYYVRQGAGAPVKITNHSPDYLQSLFNL